MGRQEQEEGYAEVEGRKDGQASPERGSKESETRETDTWSQRKRLRVGRGGGLGVTGNHRKAQQEIQSHETGRDRQWETETIERQRHRDTQSERDIVPEYVYNLRVLGRQRRRHTDSGRARRSEGGRATQSQAGTGTGTGGGQVWAARSPHPTLVMPFPMIPGAGVRAHPSSPPGERSSYSSPDGPGPAPAAWRGTGGLASAAPPSPAQQLPPPPPPLPADCGLRREMMVEPPPPLPPQAPPTASVMWGPLPWVAAGGWTKPQCAGPRARGTTAACWSRVGPIPPEMGAGALPPPWHCQALAGLGAERAPSRGLRDSDYNSGSAWTSLRALGQSTQLLRPRFSSRNTMGAEL